MAYDLIEVSNELGKPIYLYEFELEGVYARYSTGAVDQRINGETYEGLNAQDQGIRQSGDATSDAFSLLLPFDTAVARWFIGTPPSRSVYLTVRHTHEGEPQASVCYVGEVTQCDFKTPGMVNLAVVSLVDALDREGLRLGYSRTCPYAVYDKFTCKVDRDLHKVEGVVIGVTDNIVTSDAFAGFPDGALVAGYIEWEHPERGFETRGIIDHVGNRIVLLGMADNIYYGLPIKAYRGCDQLEETCINVFDNLLNNGAWLDMPGVSPFDGNSMY